MRHRYPAHGLILQHSFSVEGSSRCSQKVDHSERKRERCAIWRSCLMNVRISEEMSVNAPVTPEYVIALSFFPLVFSLFVSICQIVSTVYLLFLNAILALLSYTHKTILCSSLLFLSSLKYFETITFDLFFHPTCNFLKLLTCLVILPVRFDVS